MNYEQTAKQAVAAWDAGDLVWTIEMGGMGPGYEQAIQVLAVEILRDAIAAEEATDKALDIPAFEALANATCHKHDETLGGLSGAQFGAAQHLAYRAYTDGWGPMLKKAKESGLEDDRFTMVSKHWPRAQVPA